jgi:hypothetical protein
MSRTVKGSKSPGVDWWSRRPMSGITSASSRKAGTMKWLKRRVHKIERRAAPTGGEE